MRERSRVARRCDRTRAAGLYAAFSKLLSNRYLAFWRASPSPVLLRARALHRSRAQPLACQHPGRVKIIIFEISYSNSSVLLSTAVTVLRSNARPYDASFVRVRIYSLLLCRRGAGGRLAAGGGSREGIQYSVRFAPLRALAAGAL